MTSNFRTNGLLTWVFILLLIIIAVGSWILGARQRPLPAPEPELPVKTGDGSLNLPHLAWVNFSSDQVMPKNPPLLLPADAILLFATVNLKDAGISGKVTGRWWWNGQEMPHLKVNLENNSATIELQRPKKLAFGPGIGELELRDGKRRIAYGSFLTTDQPNAIMSQVAPPTGRTQVTQLFIAASADKKQAPGAKKLEFKPKERIYAVFQYQLAEPQSSFVVHWGIDGREIDTAQKIITVEKKDGVAWAWIQAGGKTGLPPAKYEVWITYTTNPEKLALTAFDVK